MIIGIMIIGIMIIGIMIIDSMIIVCIRQIVNVLSIAIVTVPPLRGRLGGGWSHLVGEAEWELKTIFWVTLCFRRTCFCYVSQYVCLSWFLSKKHWLRKKEEPQHLQIQLNPKPKSKNY